MAMDRIRTHGEMYSIQHKLIKCDSDLQQVGGSLQVLGSEKLIQIQYVLRQAKHFNYSILHSRDIYILMYPYHIQY